MGKAAPSDEPADTQQHPHAAVLRPLILARNADGLYALARDLGIPNEELAAFVRQVVEAEVARGIEDRVGPRFDVYTGKYTPLEAWADRFLKAL